MHDLLAGPPLLQAVQPISETAGGHTLSVAGAISKFVFTFPVDWTLTPRIFRRCREEISKKF